MTHTEYLESIIEEAQELLNYANAGGREQYAFDLMASTNDLCSAFDNLWRFGSRVREELDATELAVQ